MKVHLSNVRQFPPTRKLFHEDPYLRTCKARVLVVEGRYVVTDQTVFYAESGGQAPDQGKIGDVEVIDVQKAGGRMIYINDNPYNVNVPATTVDTVVVHELKEQPDFVAGDEVDMAIDWPKRYLHMRNHSASHFLYYAAHQIFGRPTDPPLNTKGCYIYDKSARFDFYRKLDSKMVPTVAEIANDLLARGMNIEMVPDTQTNEVFYWTYEGIIIPCGGTHVREAGEIGRIRVKRSSQGKSIDRLYSILEEERDPNVVA